MQTPEQTQPESNPSRPHVSDSTIPVAPPISNEFVEAGCEKFETQSETARQVKVMVLCHDVNCPVSVTHYEREHPRCTALKSPELPGDAKARIEEITNRVYEHKYQHGELNTLECITVALAELHAQRQREIAALREENERMRSELRSIDEALYGERLPYTPDHILTIQTIKQLKNDSRH